MDKSKVPPKVKAKCYCNETAAYHFTLMYRELIDGNRSSEANPELKSFDRCHKHAMPLIELINLEYQKW